MTAPAAPQSNGAVKWLWLGVDAILVIVIAGIISSVIEFVQGHAHPINGMSSQDLWRTLGLTILIYGLLFAFLFLLRRLRDDNVAVWWNEWQGRPLTVKSFLGWGWLVITAAFLLGFLANYFSGVLGGNAPEVDRLELWLAVPLAIVAGMGEELLFRGLIQSWVHDRAGPIAAVIIQAILFAAGHTSDASWAHIAFALGFGLVAGIVALRVGLLPVMYAHATIDVLALSHDSMALIVVLPLSLGFVLLAKARKSESAATSAVEAPA